MMGDGWWSYPNRIVMHWGTRDRFFQTAWGKIKCFFPYMYIKGHLGILLTQNIKKQYANAVRKINYVQTISDIRHILCCGVWLQTTFQFAHQNSDATAASIYGIHGLKTIGKHTTLYVKIKWNPECEFKWYPLVAC